MPAIPTVLVVAPDGELRRSIAFVLEAEGLGVVCLDSLPVPGFAARFACAVVDEAAVGGDFDAVLALQPPVIMLIDRLRRLPERLAAWAIEKPLLGNRLVAAVGKALGYGGSAAVTA